MRAIGLIVLCAVLATGCGGSSQPELDRLPGGRAEGPGFRFGLSEQWRALETTEELEREVSEAVAAELPGFDAEAGGLLFAGAWVNLDQRDLRPVVNVAVEPLTADTSLETLATTALAPIEQKIGEPPTREPAMLGGDPAVSYAYRDEDDKDRQVENRGMAAKRGDLAYTLTVQMTGPGAGDRVDELFERVVAGWKWQEPDGEEQEELSSLSEFEGEGYRLIVPPGWRASGKQALAEAGQPGFDALWRGWIGSRFSTNVNVARIDFPAGDLAVALREVARDERRSDAAAPAYELDAVNEVQAPGLDGEPAGALELTSTANGNRLRQLEVVALHESQLYRITLSSLRERFPAERRVFLEALATWRWE